MTTYQDINQVGIFRGEIIEYGLLEFESNSVAILVEVRVDEAWDSEAQEWVNWREYAPVKAEGAMFVIKKDGTVNNKQVEALVQYADWDGNLESIINHSWQPKPCQIVVNEDRYKPDQIRYRISWLNDYNRTPGGAAQIAPERAKELNAKFGSSLRAVAGNAKKPPTPNGKPKAPPPSPKPDREPVTAENTPKDEVPF